MVNQAGDIVEPRCGIVRMSSVPRRDRALVALSIFTMCALAWAYLIYLASAMPTMHEHALPMSMAMPATHAWKLTDVTAMFVMWSVMMIGMMLPSATSSASVMLKGMKRYEHKP